MSQKTPTYIILQGIIFLSVLAFVPSEQVMGSVSYLKNTNQQLILKEQEKAETETPSEIKTNTRHFLPKNLQYNTTYFTAFYSQLSDCFFAPLLTNKIYLHNIQYYRHFPTFLLTFRLLE